MADLSTDSINTRYRAAIEGSLEAFYLLGCVRDHDGRLVDFVIEDLNPRAQELHAQTRAALVGRRLSEAAPMLVSSGILERFVQVYTSATPVDEDYHIDAGLPIDGWYHHQIIPLPDGIAVFMRSITERRQLYEALAAEHLEQERLRGEVQRERDLNAFKYSLMRTIAHEFRNPLATILTSIDFLDRYAQRLSEDERAERFQSMRVNVKGLSDMLEDIAILVRQSSDMMAVQAHPVDLTGIVWSAVSKAQRKPNLARELIYTADSGAHVVNADINMLSRVFDELVANAIRYSPPASAIHINIAREDGSVRTLVRNEGAGIVPDEQARIFEPFFRGSSSTGTTGTGLGLSIIKRFIEAHEGSIAVTSTPGEATEFVIRLPLVE